MKALVIYDSVTGVIYNIIYGDDQPTPQGIPWMWVDIPDGAILDKIDVTDAENPKAVFTYKPESDISRLQNIVADMAKELANTQLALAEQYEENLALQEEVTNTQLALCEIYERMEV